MSFPAPTATPTLESVVADFMAMGASNEIILRLIAYDKARDAADAAKLEARAAALKTQEEADRDKCRAEWRERQARKRERDRLLRLGHVTEMPESHRDRTSHYSIESTSSVGLTTSREADKTGREERKWQPKGYHFSRAEADGRDAVPFVEDAAEEFQDWATEEGIPQREWNRRFTAYIDERLKRLKFKNLFRRRPAEPLQEGATEEEPGEAAEPQSSAQESIEAPQAPEVESRPKPASPVAVGGPATCPERKLPWLDPDYPMDREIRGIFTLNLWERFERQPGEVWTKYGVTFANMIEAKRIRAEFLGIPPYTLLPAPERQFSEAARENLRRMGLNPDTYPKEPLRRKDPIALPAPEPEPTLTPMVQAIMDLMDRRQFKESEIKQKLDCSDHELRSARRLWLSKNASS